MSSREVYRKWVLGVILVSSIGCVGCTEEQRRECRDKGYPEMICSANPDDGGGNEPPDIDNGGT